MCNPSEYGGCESRPEFAECSTDARNEMYAWEQDHCDEMFTKDEYMLDDDYEY